jgi:hypothetical protein
MSAIHTEPHPLAGHTIDIPHPDHPLTSELVEYRIEDWYDRVAGCSWMVADGNMTALKYAIRSGALGLPTDNLVVYGHINGLAQALHESELPG